YLPNVLGPPRCRSIPVLALLAQLPTGLASRPTHRGTRPPQVLTAQGANGRSRQAGPSGQSTNKTSFEHVKGTGGLDLEQKPILAPRTAGVDVDRTFHTPTVDVGAGEAPGRVTLLKGKTPLH